MKKINFDSIDSIMTAIITYIAIIIVSICIKGGIVLAGYATWVAYKTIKKEFKDENDGKN